MGQINAIYFIYCWFLITELSIDCYRQEHCPQTINKPTINYSIYTEFIQYFGIGLTNTKKCIACLNI